MRYIDADKIEYEDMLRPHGNGNYEECQIAYRDQIDDIPTADVPSSDSVEVVRCKDCKYGKKDSLFVGGYECSIFDNSNVEADDYCSYGERKEE